MSETAWQLLPLVLCLVGLHVMGSSPCKYTEKTVLMFYSFFCFWTSLCQREVLCVHSVPHTQTDTHTHTHTHTHLYRVRIYHGTTLVPCQYCDWEMLPHNRMMTAKADWAAAYDDTYLLLLLGCKGGSQVTWFQSVTRCAWGGGGGWTVWVKTKKKRLSLKIAFHVPRQSKKVNRELLSLHDVHNRERSAHNLKTYIHRKHTYWTKDWYACCCYTATVMSSVITGLLWESLNWTCSENVQKCY